jgi:hypothetical protein
MKYKIVNNEVRVRHVLHRFTILDCDDSNLYVDSPVHQWQQTPEGKFCMEKATDLEIHKQLDHNLAVYQVTITGYITEKHATFLALKRA